MDINVILEENERLKHLVSELQERLKNYTNMRNKKKNA
jgi:hypothetical protein